MKIVYYCTFLTYFRVFYRCLSENMMIIIPVDQVLSIFKLFQTAHFFSQNGLMWNETMHLRNWAVLAHFLLRMGQIPFRNWKLFHYFNMKISFILWYLGKLHSNYTCFQTAIPTISIAQKCSFFAQFWHNGIRSQLFNGSLPSHKPNWEKSPQFMDILAIKWTKSVVKNSEQLQLSFCSKITPKMVPSLKTH